MIPLSELKVLEDAFYIADTTYYKPSFYPFIEKTFSEDLPFEKNSIMKLKKLIVRPGKKAHDLILKQDLKKIEKALDKVPKEFDQKIWRDYLPDIRREVKNALGMEFKPRSIFFENSFPSGLFIYDKKGATSVTIFEGQPNTGLYFLNKRISSFFAPIILIHEQLHSCLSQNKSKDQVYVEWFEEGLCQWYSILIYFRLTNNRMVVDLYKQRNYIYSRTKPEYNITRRYFEYMKLFSKLFLAGGEELIGKILLDYLSNKRDKVNKYLKIDELKIENKPKNQIEQVLSNYTSIIEPEKVTPLEYLILKTTKIPVDLDFLAKKIRAPEDVMKKGVLRLKLKGMIVLKGNKIEINWRKKDLFDYNLIKPVFPF